MHQTPLEARRGRWSRRRLLQGVALGAGAVAAVAACGETQIAQRTVESELPAATPASATTPQYGGRLRWAHPGTLAGRFDPALASGVARFITNWVYEPLVDVDAQYNEIPRLAESWLSEDGGKAWVFNLREGVRFHHGREFIADDVIHTFNRILNPEFGSSGAAVYGGIDAIEALDSFTVRFILSARDGDFPLRLAAFQGKIVPYDRTDRQVNDAPRGTGPFTIDTYASADRVVFQRNPTYWMAERPYLDEIEFVNVSGEAALVGALRGGDVDIAFDISPRLVRQLGGDPKVRPGFAPVTGPAQMLMQASHESGALDWDLVFANWARETGIVVGAERLRADRFYASKWLRVPFGVNQMPQSRVDGQPGIGYTADAQRNVVRGHTPHPLNGPDPRNIWLADR